MITLVTSPDGNRLENQYLAKLRRLFQDFNVMASSGKGYCSSKSSKPSAYHQNSEADGCWQF